MTRYWALMSLVYMMAFVIQFDKVHWLRNRVRLFLAGGLLSRDEVARLVTIYSACQDS